jgi:hypothetical protein
MLNPIKKIATSALMLLMIPILMSLAGCGNTDAKNDGCPSDSYAANSTDIIITPSDASQTLLAPFGGGPVNVTPLLFSVTDKDGNPRNKICMIFYTDGTFYTNNSFSVPYTGANLIAVTDGQGKVLLYWQSPILPASNPINGTSSGKDVTINSFVQVYSGVLSKLFTYTWTVQGVQAP